MGLQQIEMFISARGTRFSAREQATIRSNLGLSMGSGTRGKSRNAFHGFSRTKVIRGQICSPQSSCGCIGRVVTIHPVKRAGPEIVKAPGTRMAKNMNIEALGARDPVLWLDFGW